MKPLLLLLLIPCSLLGGCSSEEVGKSSATAFDPIIEFQSQISCHNFDSASTLVAEPSRFYRAKNGDWIIASPSDNGLTEWTVRASESIWVSRFVNSHFESTTLFDETDDVEIPCQYLVTGVMCDPLQTSVLFVPQNNKLLLVVDPIGHRKNFTLD